MSTPSHTSSGRAPALALALLAALAAGAVATAATTARIERRNRPRGRFTTAGGLRLHVLERGVGRSVLLIHGNGVTAEDWRSSGIFQDLSRSHHVLAPDRPGCGWSERPNRPFTLAEQADVLADLLRTKASGPAIVVGHSLGGQIALELALRHRNRVGGLVLVSPYATPTFRLDSALSALMRFSPVDPIWRRTAGTPLMTLMRGLILSRMFGPRRAPFGYGEGPLAMSFRPRQMRASMEDAAAMISGAELVAPRLQEIDVPTTVMLGEADRLVDPKRQARQIAQLIPGARLVSVSRAGHMAHHAAPDAVAAAVHAAIRGASGGVGRAVQAHALRPFAA